MNVIESLVLSQGSFSSSKVPSTPSIYFFQCSMPQTTFWCGRQNDVGVGKGWRWEKEPPASFGIRSENLSNPVYDWLASSGNFSSSQLSVCLQSHVIFIRSTSSLHQQNPSSSLPKPKYHLLTAITNHTHLPNFIGTLYTIAEHQGSPITFSWHPSGLKTPILQTLELISTIWTSLPSRLKHLNLKWNKEIK